YSSLGFEMLSYELLSKKLNLNLNEIYSFWTNELEIDVFAKFNDKFIVGEVKYKDRKICKNILNLINTKCQKLGISPDIIALFSKSGFSKELLNLKSENLLLFDLNDFKSLID
ncbi:ATPase, partial [Campylobacter sp. FMV-PI01]